MSDIVRTSIYDQLNDKMIEKVTYDNSEILKMNAADRADRTSQGKYKGNLVHAARIHLGDIDRLRNIGYNLLTYDIDEVRRALMYVQQNERDFLTVDGTPFAKTRPKWV